MAETRIGSRYWLARFSNAAMATLSVPASCTMTKPDDAMRSSPARICASSCSCVASGIAFSNNVRARFKSTPVKLPSMSLRISPPSGATVSLVIPAL